MHRLAITAAALSFGLALPAAAQPPEGALPLSQVLATLEGAAEVAWIEEVEWDSDGHWEVEYRDRDGREVEVTLDPMTGEQR